MIRKHFAQLSPFDWSEEEWQVHYHSEVLTQLYISELICKHKALKVNKINGYMIIHSSTQPGYKYQVTQFYNDKPAGHADCVSALDAATKLAEYTEGQPELLEVV